jgi:hypothetical protein
MTSKMLFSYAAGDLLLSLLVPWFDVDSLLAFDKLITKDQDDLNRASIHSVTAMWLRCLKNAGGLSVLNDFEYDLTTIRWLIQRGISASSIKFKKSVGIEKTDLLNLSVTLLETADLRECRNIMDVNVSAVATGCTNLRLIDLFRCHLHWGNIAAN